ERRRGGRHLRRRREDALVRDGLRLGAALRLRPDGAPRVGPAPTDPRLHTPASGYYWQVSTAAGAMRSRSLWDADLARPVDVPSHDWTLRHANGPFGEQVTLVERQVAPDAGGPEVLVQLAQD